MRINKLTVQGFRGFTREKTIDFSNPVTILYGNNAQGKSSTLNAIEWCLFGDRCAGLATGIRERKDWKPENRTGTVPCKVTMLCDSADGIITFERVIKAANHGLTIKTGTNVIKAEFANKWVNDNLGPFMDFMAMVYQHQENIRHLALAEPRDKRNIINRMLGLGEYNEVIGAIVSSKYDKWSSFVQSYIDSINERVQDRITGYKDQNKEICDTLQVNANLVSVKSVHQKTGALQNMMKDLMGQPVADLNSTQIQQSPREISDWVGRIKQKARQFFIQSPSGKQNQVVNELISRLESKLLALDTSKHELLQAETVLSKFVANHGERVSVKVKIDGLVEEKKLAELELASTNALYAALIPLYQYLEEKGLGIGREKCPACGSDTKDQLAYLAGKLQTITDAKAKRLSKKVDDLTNRLENADTTLQQIDSLTKQVEAFRKGYSAKSEKIALELKIQLRKGEGLEKVISAKIKEASINKAKYEAELQLLQPKIQAIEDECDVLFDFCKVLENKDHIKRLSNIQDDPSYKKLIELLKYAEVQSQDVAAVVKAVEAVRDEEGRSRVDRSVESIRNCFNTIADNPGIVDLEMCLERARGNEDFRFRDKEGDDVISILSQGDLNALAISIFYGIGESGTSDAPLNTIIFDDPTQSMATHHKQKLATLISGAAQNRQVIVSTMDSEFLSMLINGITMDMKMVEFKDWRPSAGPVVN